MSHAATVDDAPRGADPRPPLHVAAGVLVRADGAVLLAQRPAGKAYAGWWEFPGGKIEAGETPARGLARELHEELGVHVESSLPWIVREHAYPHANVRLYFRRVLDWHGEPHPREGQRLAWSRPAAVRVAPLLPATVPLLAMLALPPRIAVAGPALADAGRLAAAIGALDAAAFGMVLLRVPASPSIEARRCIDAARDACEARGIDLQVAPAGACPAQSFELVGESPLRVGDRPVYAAADASGRLAEADRRAGAHGAWVRLAAG